MKFVDDIPTEGIYAYNLKTQNEALSVLKTLAKARHEEQNNIIKRIEARLCFEIEKLGEPAMTTCADGEDLMQTQDSKDRSVVIRNLIGQLVDLISRDREALGMGRRVTET